MDGKEDFLPRFCDVGNKDVCLQFIFFCPPHCKESRNLRETKRKMPKRLSLCSLFSFSFLQKCPTFEIASFIPFLVHFSFLFCLHHTHFPGER